MKTVLISGNFDPFTFAHLEYIKQALALGNLICLISSDKQVVMKKGKVNEPAFERQEILFLILKGLGVGCQVLINKWDKETLAVEALRHLKPDIFCRGTDKSIEDIPPDEKKVCEELGIEIVHVKGKQAHGSEFI
ncbi:hypothetical protein LCGC14_0821060 [marine sediment metagenome]|uniref:Cytidyltransferase-like domain-containing protein n=1 Tax=marine sediment metagenome TaxID=412755 RepID=A0A0F9S3P9_9ZZZZ